MAARGFDRVRQSRGRKFLESHVQSNGRPRRAAPTVRSEALNVPHTVQITSFVPLTVVTELSISSSVRRSVETEQADQVTSSVRICSRSDFVRSCDARLVT